jgi:hypothetical protein
LGGLLFALGLGWGKAIYHKLGYAKPVYFGSILVEATREAGAPSLLNPDNSALDMEALALAYYKRHEEKIAPAVAIMREEWSAIGDGCAWSKDAETRTLAY